MNTASTTSVYGQQHSNTIIDGEPVLSAVSDAMLEKGDFSESGPVVLPAQQNLFGDPVQNRFVMFESEHAVQRERTALDTLRRAFFRAPSTDRPELRARIAAQERQTVYASLHEKSERAMQQIEVISKKAALPGGLKKGEQSRLVGLGTQLERLTTLERDLANPAKPLPFFLYRLHFHEVFATRGGFDVVIANPPYVRQENITAQKPELQASYPEVYMGTADLYVYFYAQALRLLRPNGELAFISPNKFFKANYGTKLREHLATFDVQHIVDFGELPVFKAAATFPMIFALRKAPNLKQTRFTQVTSWHDSDHVRDVVKAQGLTLPANSLSGAAWSLTNAAHGDLITKLKAAGKPLGEYVKGQILYGVKTGFNKAFAIDGVKRAELIAADPRSAEIIKPFAAGDDVRKWHIKKQDT